MGAIRVCERERECDGWHWTRGMPGGSVMMETTWMSKRERNGGYLGSMRKKWGDDNHWSRFWLEG